MADLWRPVEVLDQQVSLVRWWASSPYASTVVGAFADTFDQQGLHLANPEAMPVTLADRINRAESIFVTTHIVNKLWGFSKRYETKQVLTRDDLPCERGYAWLQTPLYVYDGFRSRRPGSEDCRSCSPRS